MVEVLVAEGLKKEITPFTMKLKLVDHNIRCYDISYERVKDKENYSIERDLV
jgi:hypothetical protein